RNAERLLEREQPFEHADRRVERRAHRAALGLAVPAAVRELFAQQAIDEPIAALAEIGAECDDPAVDARLDLALEEGRVAEFGPHVTWLRTRSIAVRARALVGSIPRSRRNTSVYMFDHQNGVATPSPHWPSGRCSSSSRRPHPSDATRDRSAATM